LKNRAALVSVLKYYYNEPITTMALVMFWNTIKMKYLTIGTVEHEAVESGFRVDDRVLM